MDAIIRSLAILNVAAQFDLPYNASRTVVAGMGAR